MLDRTKGYDGVAPGLRRDMFWIQELMNKGTMSGVRFRARLLGASSATPREAPFAA
jgi:hypothetical protein